MNTIKTLTGILSLAFLLFLAGCDNSNQTTQPPANANGLEKVTPPPAPPAPAGPMGFEKTQYDFGTIVSGDSVVAIYPFVNNQVQQLEIERFYTSCGCISAEGPDHPLEPGERGEVEVTFRSKDQPIARYEKIVSVAFVGKANYLLPLQLNGNVVAGQ